MGNGAGNAETLRVSAPISNDGKRLEASPAILDFIPSVFNRALRFVSLIRLAPRQSAHVQSKSCCRVALLRVAGRPSGVLKPRTHHHEDFRAVCLPNMGIDIRSMSLPVWHGKRSGWLLLITIYGNYAHLGRSNRPSLPPRSAQFARWGSVRRWFKYTGF